MHAPIGGDEHHIQRCDGIAHPHGTFAWAPPIEQHALIRLHFRAEHQADHLLFRLHGHFDREGKPAPIAGFKYQGFGRQARLGAIHPRLRQGSDGQQGGQRQQGTSLHKGLHDTGSASASSAAAAARRTTARTTPGRGASASVVNQCSGGLRPAARW